MKDIRQRMIEDMKLRGLTPSTQATYLEAVKVLARHYNRRSDEITQEQVRDFLLYLIDTKRLEEDMDAEVSPPSESRPCPHCQKGTLVRIGRLFRQGRAPP